MAVDTNFERLEQEVTRLVDLLGRMRQDNAELKHQVDELTTETGQLKSQCVRLAQVETELKEMGQNREVIRGRIVDLLAKLESVEA
ncbi:MAG: cell division protein ZapB [Candidatus Latescibacterota bacterium]|jgi:FtsZ-binding cell division protein ZapB